MSDGLQAISGGRPFALRLWAVDVERYLEAGQFGVLLVLIVALPLSESVKNIAFGLGVGIWILRAYLGQVDRLRVTTLGALQGLLVAVAAASVFRALNSWEAVRGLWDLSRSWLTFLLFLNTVTSCRRLRLCWAFFIGSTAVGALIGILRFSRGLPEAIKAKTVGGSFALEILSLGHPNHTATYLLMMIVLALAYLNYRRYLKEGLWPWLYLVGAVLLIPSLILTFSRSAGLTFVLLILVFGAALGRRKLVGGLIALALVGVISASTVPSISRYFTDATHPFSTGAIADRIHVWKGILRLVNDQPFLGVGPRNFNYFDKSRYGIDLSLGYFNHAHSLYFNVLAELGWMGLASLILWLGAGAFVVWRSKRRLASPWGRVVWLGALGCLFAFTISGIMTTTFHTEGAMAFSAVLAIALAAREFDQSEEEALYGGA